MRQGIGQEPAHRRSMRTPPVTRSLHYDELRQVGGEEQHDLGDVLGPPYLEGLRDNSA
jgi:hypothetical protein